MAHHPDYPDVATHRRRSVLPPQLQSDLVALSEAIHRGADITNALSACLSGLAALPPSAIARAAEEIPMAGRFSARSPAQQRSWSLLRRKRDPARQAELKALTKHPALGRLFLFHGDGWLREAALLSLPAPPDNAFEFAALAYRLNDWVEQVRRAARATTTRLFPQTSAGVVAAASLVLIPQARHFGRWRERERDLLETTLYRPDVMQAFAELLSQRPPGPMGTILRQALRKPGLDDMLPDLARTGAFPLVRATAYETLIMRRARWLEGYGHEWVDKRFGLRRRIPRFGQRPIEHRLDREQLLTEAADDRAVTVRKVATRALIDLRQELSPAMQDVARRLSQDPSRTVRSRAAFYLKAQAGS